MSAVTVRLDPELERRLRAESEGTGRQASEIVRDALREHLWRAQLERVRRELLPHAEAAGVLTDEDVAAVITAERRERRGARRP